MGTVSSVEGQNFNFGYQTNGLISSRTNAWRGYNVTGRDVRGRATSTTTQVAGVTGAVLAEGLTWLDDDRQASYAAQRGALPSDAIAAWTDGRAYNYDLGRRRLNNETLSLPQGGSSQLTYSYDQAHAGLGVRTMAVQGSATASDFQSLVDASDNGATNAFARIVREKMNHQVSDFDAQGTALGAQSVSLALEHANSQSSRVTVRPVSHPGPLDNQGAWRAPMRLWPGSYTLHASADHPSGTFTANSQTTFLLQREMLNVNNTYDEEGNIISRIWSAGSTTVRTQNLTWDGQGRLIHVLDRDLNGHGYDWNARYDGLGRRIGTTTQTVRANVAYGAVFEEGSWYDPLVEFLEIAVETRQVGVANSERRTWKVHGPDANGSYGGLHGIGGLEALVEETDGAKTALIDDYYGHIIANVEVATLTARWSVTRSQSYGPTPDSPTYTLYSGASLVQTLAWQGRRVDVTGYYSMGARYYDATGGRFLSPDPLGHAASMDLYSFAGGDPVNFVDPTGRYQRGYIPNVQAPGSNTQYWSNLSKQAGLNGEYLDASYYGMRSFFSAMNPFNESSEFRQAGREVTNGMSTINNNIGDLVDNGQLHWTSGLIARFGTTIASWGAGSSFGSANYMEASDHYNSVNPFVVLGSGVHDYGYEIASNAHNLYMNPSWSNAYDTFEDALNVGTIVGGAILL